jgi:hypothetical protein
MNRVTPESADPGSLKVQERRITDSLGGQYLMRERTWTSDGIPHRELTIVDPPTQASSSPNPPTGPTNTQTTPADKSVVVPDRNRKADTQPQASSLPEPPNGPATTQAVPENESAIAPKANRKTKTELKTVPRTEKATEKPSTTQQNARAANATGIKLDKQAPQPAPRPLAGAAGVGVTVDPKQGTRIYRYYQGNVAKGTQRSTGTQVFSNIQVQPGTDNMVGVGVSTDSTGDTRVYRYYRGNAANVPSQPAKKTTP